MKEHNIQDRGYAEVNYELPQLPLEKKPLSRYTPSGLTLSCPFELKTVKRARHENLVIGEEYTPLQ